MNIGRYADHVGTENADHVAQNLFFCAPAHTTGSRRLAL